MGTERSIMGKLSTVGRAFGHGGAGFKLLTALIVGVLLINMVISVWCNFLFQKHLNQKANVQTVRMIGSVLAKTTEALLVAGEISILRRAITGASIEHNFEYCRIVLPDGKILADSDPKQITAIRLPESWTKPSRPYAEKFNDGCVMFRFPLDVPGRGGASLEIAGSVAGHSSMNVQSQTAQLAIVCLALVVLLLVHHHVHPKLRVIDAIYEALLETQPTQGGISVLEIDPKLGTEALAWNKIINQSEGQQVRATFEQVKKSIQEWSEVNVGLTAVCDALPYGLIVIDENMCVEYANGAAASLLRTRVNEIKKKEISQYITHQRVIGAIHDAAGSPIYKRTIVEVEQEESTSSSVLRFFVRPIYKEDLGVTMVMIEDVTQQRMAEEARSSFLASAAHELRTPLTNIRLCVETALDDSDNNSATTLKSLNVANEEILRLERIVSGILSVAEVEAGSFSLVRDDVHLDVLLEQLKSDYEPRAREKQIALEFDVPPKLPILYADRDKILLALHNLLGNALKYTPENQRVALTVTHENGQINIAISDTGIGMAPEEVEKIFDKFYRGGDKRVTEIKGSGLGLAIARQVIRNHGGDIAVDTELNKGSTFTLTLPVTEEVA